MRTGGGAALSPPPASAAEARSPRPLALKKLERAQCPEAACTGIQHFVAAVTRYIPPHDSEYPGYLIQTGVSHTSSTPQTTQIGYRLTEAMTWRSHTRHGECSESPGVYCCLVFCFLVVTWEETRSTATSALRRPPLSNDTTKTAAHSEGTMACAQARAAAAKAAAAAEYSSADEARCARAYCCRSLGLGHDQDTPFHCFVLVPETKQ